MDIKDLKDLLGHWERIPFGSPCFQFTARMVPEDTLWLGFRPTLSAETFFCLFVDSSGAATPAPTSATRTGGTAPVRRFLRLR